MADFVIKQHDTRPVLEAQIQDATGVAINLTGCIVRFLMLSTAGGQPKINATCAIIDPTAGKVRYSWHDGDTDTWGSYYAEFEVTFPDGSVQTVPNDGFLTIEVKRDIA